MAGEASQRGPVSRWIWVVVCLVLAFTLGGGAFVLDHGRVQKNDRKLFGEMVKKLRQRAFVLVTKGKIFMDGEAVATTRAATDSDSADWKVAALHRALEARRYRHNMALEQTFHQEVALCVAAQTDFKVLKKLLRTCGLAGYSDQHLGVPEGTLPADVSGVKASDCTMVELEPGPKLNPASVEGRVKVTVLVGEDGYTVTAGGERMVIARKAGALDFAGLGKQLGRIRARVPRKDDLTVAVEEEITAGQLVKALEAIQKPGFRYLALVDEAGVSTAYPRAETDQKEALKGIGGIDDPSQPGGIVGLGEQDLTGKGGGARTGHSRKTSPRVVAGRAEVRGALDKEIIRRIVRRHLNEVKYCYQQGLSARTEPTGRVVIQFTIAGSGQVVMSVVQKSTLNNRPVETCIARAVRRWLFPKPRGGGIVIVSYPFVLRTVRGK